MAIIEVKGSEVLCSVPSRFMRDWILANYIERLKILWNEEVALIQSVTLVIQTKPNSSPQDRNDESSFILDGTKSKVKQSAISGDKEIKGEIAAPLDPKFTFDQFVVGKPNDFAYAAARRVAEASTVSF
jgi:ATPase involved in DNA replication initiation